MTTNLPADTCDVLGYRLARVDLGSAATKVIELAGGASPRTALVVTLNPEIVIRAQSDSDLRTTLDRAALCVADGVGILWAARRHGCTLPGRVAGVELTAEVLRRAGPTLRVYFLGSRPGVAAAAAAAAHSRYGTVIAGSHHGYFSPGEAETEVAAAIRASGAQLLLCGLGERQELFVDRHSTDLGAGAAIGVGGTLDVMAGAVARTPGWTRQLQLEWLWRVGTNPRRWHRIPRLMRFVGLVLRSQAR